VCNRVKFGTYLRAYLGASSQATVQSSVMVSAGERTWECTVKQAGSVQSSRLGVCNQVQPVVLESIVK